MNSLEQFRKDADHLKKLIKLNGSGNDYHYELFKGYPELVQDLINALEISQNQVKIFLERDAETIKAGKTDYYENFKNMDLYDLEDDDEEDNYGDDENCWVEYRKE